MWGKWFRRVAVGLVVLLSLLVFAGSALAGGPGTWTMVGTSDQGFDTFGVLRTADRSLHLVWQARNASDRTQSYDWATISVAGRVLGTGTAISGWQTLEFDPQLVPNGSGMRLIFEGNTGPIAGCYQQGEIFTATSTTGASWALVTGSLSQATVGTGNIAATTESDQATPVTVFSAGHHFHVGVDPSCPATSSDGTITPSAGSSQGNPATVTDQKTGAVYAAWFQSSVQQAYWVEQILPTQGPPIEAPSSATHVTPFENNQPIEPVALVARPGGGVYMAYCVASSTQPCAHIDLWRVGSPKVMVVPGSRNVIGARVAIAGDTLGNISVAWFNGANGKTLIHSVRTNPAVTAWGSVRTTVAPRHTASVNDLQAEGSSARLDLLAVVEPSTAGTPFELFQTQVLPGLTLTAKPASLSHKRSKKVTLTVSDAGQPIRGAFVSCLGKHGTTNSAGRVKLKVRKGQPLGKHRCTAAHVDYAVGTVTIKIT